tara:strand:- start:458 stop:739 length:282 start_codon:yes stop_codon:yes gene_type:complete
MKNLRIDALKKLVRSEVAKINEEKLTGELKDSEKAAKDVPEVDASEYATALEQDIDFMKALKIQEKRLLKNLKKIQEAKYKLRSRILKGIDKE